MTLDEAAEGVLEGVRFEEEKRRPRIRSRLEPGDDGNVYVQSKGILPKNEHGLADSGTGRKNDASGDAYNAQEEMNYEDFQNTGSNEYDPAIDAKLILDTFDYLDDKTKQEFMKGLIEKEPDMIRNALKIAPHLLDEHVSAETKSTISPSILEAITRKM